ncbi:MAG TPA: metal ABC transporter permease [Solirubrobacteraceae bacterium]|nr:metal ABC transporter permease [Solirubrobacteraceae bacterium]
MTGVAALLAPGFFSSGPVHTALALGTVVAIVCGAVGVFTVIRSQAFAGEALSDIGAAGGSASFLVGVAPLWGFLAAGIAAAAVMEMIGVQRARGRELATGIVLGASLGLAALFLYLDSTLSAGAGSTVTILFGSLFALNASLIPAVGALSLLATGAVCTLQRPLLLSSLNPDLASVRGIPVRLLGVIYLITLAVAVALAALTIGAILGTALLVGPAATALRLTRRPGLAMLTAAGLGVVSVWIGILLSYDSFLWPPRGQGWPVSFFVVGVVFVFYLGLGLLGPRRSGRREQGGG